MKSLDFFSNPCLLVELGQNTLKVLNGDKGIEFPLERLDSGRLSDGCKERISVTLEGFIRDQPRRRRQRAVCAVSARGVSLRRLTVPIVPEEELRQLLRLQMEGEFPLPPEALAWGYWRLPPRDQPGPAQGQELVVAALKREVIEEYSELLLRIGIQPVFTLAACARIALCPHASGPCALLDVGQTHSELVSIDQGVVTAIRILAWGEEDLTQALRSRVGVAQGHSEQPERQFDLTVSANLEVRQQAQTVVASELETVAACIGRGQQKLYFTTETGRPDAILTQLGPMLGVVCERLSFPSGPGQSAATAGLVRLCESSVSFPSLELLAQAPVGGEAPSKIAPWRWLALAGLLVLAAFSLHFAEPFLFRARLSRRLSEIKSYRDGIPRIDRELSFLQYLENNQPPFLDAFYTLAASAPSGTRLDSVGMNRRGEISLRGVVASAQQATDFRSKLVDSGFFASVVLDEQNPSPDRQRVQFRMTAQWKPNGQRPRISTEATEKNIPDMKANRAGSEVQRNPGMQSRDLMPSSAPAREPTGSPRKSNQPPPEEKAGASPPLAAPAKVLEKPLPLPPTG